MKSKLNVMRKWLALIIFAACLNATNVFGDNIFSENMGAPSATTAITSWTGWQNNGILTFTGTADVRITTPSSGYIGASGVGNIYIANTVGKDFEISGINTLAYSNISLSAGIYKSTTASNGSELLIEVSSDGVTYVPMTFSLPSGTGTATWHLTTPTGAIPACANLRIRFTQTGTGPQFRIDDVVLNGTIPTPPGNALNLDGTNDFINCGNGINIAGQSFTVEFWTKREANNEDYIITQGIGNLDQGLHIGFRNATVLTFAFWADDIDVNIPYDNFWHHYAFSYDANTNLQTVYRDGNIVGTRTAFGDYVGIGTFYIGNSFGGGSEYGGSLDEVRIWNGVRSQTQIQDEMTNIISPASSGLLAYYRFDQNTGSDIFSDLTGNGNNGTLTNMDPATDWVESYAMVVPTALNATGLTQTVFTANWSAPETGIAEKYLLDISTDPTFATFLPGYQAKDMGLALTETVTGLNAATNYYYRVKADKTSVLGQGGYSATINTQTIPYPVEVTGGCGKVNVVLTASGAISGEDYKWYDAETGGNLVQTDGNTFTIPTLTATTTYYVTKYNTTTLEESAPRTPVVAKYDDLAPVPDVTTLPNVYGECSVTSLIPQTATDECVGLITGTHNATLPYTVQGTYPVTWTYDDGNGNISTQIQNIIVDDVTTVVPDLVTSNPLTVTISFGQTYLDISSWNIRDKNNTIVASGGPYYGGSPGAIAATVNFSSANGPFKFYGETQGAYNDNVMIYSITCEGSVLLSGTINPLSEVTRTINACLPVVTAECSATVTAPTAVDACTGPFTATTTDPTSYNTQGTFIVTWEYNDGNGNPSTQLQKVIIDDITAPVPDAASLVDLSADCEITSLSTPTATDNCGGIVNVSHNAILPIVGTSVITWTYDDGNGNTTTQTQNVTINDVTAPVPDLATLDNVTAECEVTSILAPTATDLCAGTVTATPDVTFPITTQGTTIVTWTYTDGNGNTTTQTQNVVIYDITDPVPVLSSLSDVTAECEVASITAPTATDNCAGTITATPNVTFPITAQGTTVVTWTYDDGNGNTTTQTQNVVIDDITLPVITACPSNIIVNNDVDLCSAVVTWVDPQATDNCSIVSFTSNYAPGSTFPVGTTTVIYTATDIDGNTATCEFTVTVNDNQNPTITCPANMVVCASDIVTYSQPIAADNCTFTVNQTAGFESGILYPVGETINAFQIVDVSSNTASCSFTVTVNPLPPVTANSTDVEICVGEEITLTGTGAISYTWDNGVTDGEVFGPTETTTYTVIGTDGNNCSNTASIEVVVNDLPTAHISGNQNICSAGNVIIPVVLTGIAPWTFSYSDGTTTNTINNVLSNPFDLAVNPVDGSYNLVTVSDANCTGTVSGTATISVTKISSYPWTENFEGTFPPSCWVINNPDGSITWQQKTVGGNAPGTKAAYVNFWSYSENGQQDDLITPLLDINLTKPALSFKVSFRPYYGTPDQLGVYVSIDGGVTYNATPIYLKSGSELATGSDYNSAFTPSVSTDWRIETIDISSFIGSNVVFKFQGTTQFGNNLYIDDIKIYQQPTAVLSGTQEICPSASADLTLNLTGTAPWSVTYTDGTTPATLSGITSSPYDFTVTPSTTSTFTLVNVIDANGLGFDVSGNAVVTVQDVTAPIPSAGTVVISLPAGQTNGWAPWVYNFADPVPAGKFITGIEMSFTARDQGFGGTGDWASFYVSGTNVGAVQLWHASQPYNINFSGPIPGYVYGGSNNLSMFFTGYPAWVGYFEGGTMTIHYGLEPIIAECSATVTTAPIAIDNCTGSITGTTTDPLTYTEQGNYIINWSYDDGNGNISTETQQIIIDDKTAPVPNVASLPDIIGQCSVEQPAAPTATDNCSATVTVSQNLGFPITTQGTYTLVWTYDDGNGNTTTQNQTIIVNDNTAPVISGCPSNIIVNNDEGNCSAIVSWTAPTATDNCTAVTTVMATSPTAGLNSGDAFPVGTTTVTYTFSDGNGNFSECSFTITVKDIEPPVLVCPANILVGNDEGQCGAIVTYSIPTVTDNCNTLTPELMSGLPSGSLFPIGVTTQLFKIEEGTSTVFFEDFANNNAGWVTGPEWGIGPAIESTGYHQGNNDPASDVTATTDNGIAGVVIGGFASTDLHETYWLISPVVDLSSYTEPLTLEFYRWLNSDYTPYMQNYVQVYDGASWVTIWQSESEAIFDDSWKYQNFDITSYKNANFQVRFGFMIGNGSVYTVGSWNIDDVSIKAGNVVTCSFDVAVEDTETPTITCPGSITVCETNSYVTYDQPIGSDNCEYGIWLDSGVPSGYDYPVGETENVYVIEDGNGNTANCSFTVTVDAMPTADAGADVDYIEGHAAVQIGGTPVTEYSYAWSPSAGLTDAAIANPLASPTTTTTFTVTVTNGACQAFDEVIVTFIPTWDITGLVSYDNDAPATALNNVKVYLLQNGVKIDSVLTDAAGAYAFLNKLNGTYDISAVTNKTWGGGNATDAQIIQNHYVGNITLTEPRVSVADVNASNAINSTDALLIKRRFTNLITSFPAGDWYFNPTPVVVEDADATMDFKGLCFGDVNGSYTPPFAKITSTINLTTAGTLEVNAGSTIDVPVRVADVMQLGAASLIFTYPLDKMDALSVQAVALGMSDLITNIEDGKVYIAWNSLQALNLQANDVLLSIRVQLTTENSDAIEFGIMPQSEFADVNGMVINNSDIMMPALQLHATSIAETVAQNISLSVFPNPITENSVVQYVLPENGNVTISVFDMNGKLVSQLVSQGQVAGTYTYLLNAANLAEGTYHIRFMLESDTQMYSARKTIVHVK